MSPTTSTLALLARRTTTTTLRPLRPSQLRSFTSARSPLLAAKDTMDKDSINTRSTEYSKTGGDDAAAHESGAFDPSETRPEAEEASGASGKKDGESSNPLNVSPANKEVSKTPAGSDESGSGAASSRSEAESKGERKVSGMGGSAKKGDAGRKL